MDLDRLFYPKSIAVVGASPGWGKGKLPYYQIIKNFGFSGTVYPINPSHKEIDGVKVYPSIDALPEPVDLAIVGAPARVALPSIEAAARKGIKYVHFFTSGFSEVGDRETEKAMLDVAAKAGTRIVGPNCLGIMCTDSGVTFNPFIKMLRGKGVAFLGQSGGVTDAFLRLANSRGISISKSVSYGNQIDLGVHDFIQYLAHDEKTCAIGAYIEDVKDGPAFLSAVRTAARKKPVFFLQGGVTEPGARAAASHTGAMATNGKVFSDALRQCGAVEVETLEELVDVAMMADSDRIPPGPRLGFMGAGGGTSVLFADLAAKNGLPLPDLEDSTRARIAEKIPDVNTSTANPVDLGAFGMDFSVMTHTMEAVGQDENVDVLIAYFSLDFIAVFQKNHVEKSPRLIVEAAQKLRKPVVSIFSRHGEDNIEIEQARLKIFSIFREAGMPVFITPQDAARALARILEWKKNSRASIGA